MRCWLALLVASFVPGQSLAARVLTPRAEFRTSVADGPGAPAASGGHAAVAGHRRRGFCQRLAGQLEQGGGLTSGLTSQVLRTLPHRCHLVAVVGEQSSVWEVVVPLGGAAHGSHAELVRRLRFDGATHARFVPGSEGLLLLDWVGDAVLLDVRSSREYARVAGVRNTELSVRGNVVALRSLGWERIVVIRTCLHKLQASTTLMGRDGRRWFWAHRVSPDGSMVATLSRHLRHREESAWSIDVWNATSATMTCSHIITLERYPLMPVGCLDFDGERVVACLGENNRGLVLHIVAGRCERAVSIDPCVSTSPTTDLQLRLGAQPAGATVAVMSAGLPDVRAAHSALMPGLVAGEALHAAHFSPDGRRAFLSWGEDFRGNPKRAYLWDIPSERAARSIDYPAFRANTPTFSPDGELLASWLGREVFLLDAAGGGQLAMSFNVSTRISSVAVSSVVHWPPFGAFPT